MRIVAWDGVAPSRNGRRWQPVLQTLRGRPAKDLLADGAYSLSLDVRLGRGTNTPQSIVFTVPGRASSNATEIL